ncbi:MAG: glycosyltransferase, partial [Methylomarinum sp.]|nr:glycosyltransferase [Methylomarinum sp.]
MKNNLEKITLPLVSIIVPVYNGENFIQESITSLLAQTYSHHEIIVVNDGSTDATSTLLTSFGDKIKIIDQANQGQGVARNNGCKEAKGTFFAFLDSDDILDVNYLEKQVSFLIKHLEAV